MFLLSTNVKFVIEDLKVNVEKVRLKNHIAKMDIRL